jgi:hypothetical protein
VTADSPTDEPTPRSDSPDPSSDAILTPYRRTQALVVLACILCFALFWQIGKWLHIPAERGFEASLLQQPNWVLDLVATYIVFACCVCIGTFIAGRSWFFGGLFSATVGLMALSGRGGGMHYVLFHAAAHGALGRVFFQLAVEQALLFLPVALIWTYFWRSYDAGSSTLKTASDTAGMAASSGMAVLVQVAIMAGAMLILTPTDAKKQVLIAVFLGAFAGTSLADYFIPEQKAAGWYWVAPFAVGLVGYLLAHFNNSGFTTGSPEGTFAALARPLPLDYASTGCAGALLGYWIGGERPHVAMRLFGGDAKAVDAPAAVS